MRKFALVALPLLTLAACSGSNDADAPGDKAAPVVGGPTLDGPMLVTPGLWRTTTSVNGKQAFGANRMCIDVDSQKASDLLSQAVETGCGQPVRRAIPGGFAYDLVCEQEGMKTTVSGQVTGDAKRVVMRSTTRMAGPDGDVAPPATVVVENLHVGACPAGMKPGDSVQEGLKAP
jgi:hypothetical protein